jgi:hypothetical protein
MAVIIVRKFLILLHRYLGIALSLLFVVWFVSGIAMMYAGGMPVLTPPDRLERMPALNFDAIQLAPAEDAGTVSVLTVLGRPAYRIDGFTTFADTGESLDGVDQEKAIRMAADYMNVAPDKVRYVELLDEADQWTIGERSRLPLHKIAIDDVDRSQLYLSPVNGDLVLITTRSSRSLAWVAAIPHWLYFRSLRVQDGIWRQVILWTSGLGCILAIAGILLGLVQFRRSSPHIPYAGWMRWHYITGIVFGVVTFTWVFSGLLSMEPYDVFSSGGVQLDRDTLGGDLELSTFPPLDAAGLKTVLAGHRVKQLDLVRLQGEPYYVARTGPERVLIDARSMKIRHHPFSTESLLSRIKEAVPDVPIVASELLSDYDYYYYSRDRTAPLPVFRLKFGDTDQTWLYVDPAMSRVLTGATRTNRVQRWIYTGLHDLDFPFWYYRRPLWDIGVIALSLGGIASSVIGLCIGFKRLFRGSKRMMFRH